jgi:hypothetical protein
MRPLIKSLVFSVRQITQACNKRKLDTNRQTGARAMEQEKYKRSNYNDEKDKVIDEEVVDPGRSGVRSYFLVDFDSAIL